MNNKNDPAFPIEYNFTNSRGYDDVNKYLGLTKREHFAGLALQGLLAATTHENDVVGNYNWYADKAVKLADELLKQLDS